MQMRSRMLSRARVPPRVQLQRHVHFQRGGGAGRRRRAGVGRRCLRTRLVGGIAPRGARQPRRPPCHCPLAPTHMKGRQGEVEAQEGQGRTNKVWRTERHLRLAPSAVWLWAGSGTRGKRFVWTMTCQYLRRPSSVTSRKYVPVGRGSKLGFPLCNFANVLYNMCKITQRKTELGLPPHW